MPEILECHHLTGQYRLPPEGGTPGPACARTVRRGAAHAPAGHRPDPDQHRPRRGEVHHGPAHLSRQETAMPALEAPPVSSPAADPVQAPGVTAWIAAVRRWPRPRRPAARPCGGIASTRSPPRRLRHVGCPCEPGQHHRAVVPLAGPALRGQRPPRGGARVSHARLGVHAYRQSDGPLPRGDARAPGVVRHRPRGVRVRHRVWDGGRPRSPPARSWPSTTGPLAGRTSWSRRSATAGPSCCSASATPCERGIDVRWVADPLDLDAWAAAIDGGHAVHLRRGAVQPGAGNARRAGDSPRSPTTMDCR